MRRPHRSIETFDISLMAVVTKAMGAFLVLMLLLLPYYTPNKQTEEDIKEIVLQLKKARESIETVSRQLGPAGGGGGAQANLQEAKTQVELAAQVVGKMRALLDKALASVARLEQENNRLAAENDRMTGELESIAPWAAEGAGGSVRIAAWISSGWSRTSGCQTPTWSVTDREEAGL